MRICFWTTGTRWRKWSRRSRALHGFTFRNIWALDQPPLADSTMTGDVAGVTFDNVKYGQRRADGNADVPLTVSAGAQAGGVSRSAWAGCGVHRGPAGLCAGREGDIHRAAVARRALHMALWRWDAGHRTPRAASLSGCRRGPSWTGQQMARGASGFCCMWKRARQPRFANQDWAAQGVVAVAHWHDAASIAGATLPGLAWQIYPGEWTELPKLVAEHAVFTGEGPNLHADSQGFTRYAAAWDGFIDIPADGGYTFYLLDRDGARLVIDGVEVAKTGPPFAQVCGSPGNAMRYDRGSLGLRAGRHTFHLEGLHSVSQGSPRLLWEGPGAAADGRAAGGL